MNTKSTEKLSSHGVFFISILGKFCLEFHLLFMSKANSSTFYYIFIWKSSAYADSFC